MLYAQFLFGPYGPVYDSRKPQYVLCQNTTMNIMSSGPVSIINAFAVQQPGFIFIDASGGTDKTFMISLILANIRTLGQITPGITATVLDGNKTAHSALKLPLNIQSNENAVCNVKK